MRSRQSLGGVARGQQERKEALEKYYRDPNHCKHCGAVIQVGDSDRVPTIRKKQFCDHSCAAKFNNAAHGPRKKHSVGRCSRCGNSFLRPRKGKTFSQARLCEDCKSKRRSTTWFRGKDLLDTTKGDVFGMRRNWQSARSTIQKHARKVYLASGRPRKCEVCGYPKHFEVSHRREVQEFSNTTKIREINDPKNLVALCPTHHWELDHGLLPSLRRL